MEKAYKLALEILLEMANKEKVYVKSEDVKLICQKALDVEKPKSSFKAVCSEGILYAEN